MDLVEQTPSISSSTRSSYDNSLRSSNKNANDDVSLVREQANNSKNELSWFEGEIDITECPNVVWVTNFESSNNNSNNVTEYQHQQNIKGSLLLTNFRLRFLPDAIEVNDNIRNVITDYDVILYNIDVVYKNYNLESYWNNLLKKYEETQYKVVTCNESFHVAERTALLRVSYRSPGVEDNAEEKIFNSIRQSHPSREFPRLFDLISYLPSTDDIRTAYTALKQICLYDSTTPMSFVLAQDGRWFSQLELTKWLDIVSKCLLLAKDVANIMSSKKLSVVLKEYTSNDLSPLISSLVQLMLDEECRTISGFQGVVKKEWIAMGFKFVSRSSSKYFSYSNNCQQSPIFVLFLDCVHQMLSLRPSSFQFNDNYLLEVWSAVCCGYFRDFLFDSPKDSYYSLLKCQIDLSRNNLNGSRMHRKNNVGSSPAATLSRRGELDLGVDGTLMRKSQLDFTVFKKQMKKSDNKLSVQSQSMFSPSYLALTDVDSYTLKSSRSQLSKFSMMSLNSTRSYSTNSTPFSKKQQISQSNQLGEHSYSPDLNNLRTLKKSSFSQQKLNGNYQRDDQPNASYDNPWIDLIGQISKEGTFQLFDWPPVFDPSKIKFQNINYKAKLDLKLSANSSDNGTLKAPSSGSNNVSKSKPPQNVQHQKSAIILNGQKIYSYSSLCQNITSPVFEFSSISFSVPFIKFWSECYLQFHPISSNFLLARGGCTALPQNQLDIYSDTYGVFYELLQGIMNVEKCLENAL
ncbi:hypothetical protein HELRODRAFT_175169 [Helobdella robusta]|uniref:Myotubularin phosphatase domain-containing protein n=1 Tax=Helobdella robusta TaxID=6412 RepID=T1F8Y5_HELRO|nr:hypothetical protein HELRODRAFT_175169 [Helobdella robusta]ESO01140.1 hypothetical protein HELRODRAFT_175169 [Helobdella robusta]